MVSEDEAWQGYVRLASDMMSPNKNADEILSLARRLMSSAPHRADALLKEPPKSKTDAAIKKALLRESEAA